MTRISSHTIFGSSIVTLILSSGLALAQDQPPTPPQSQPPANGGWRRAGDQPTADQQAPPALPPQTDPTQPVDRSDGYGQPQSAPQQSMPPQGMQQPGAPPAANRPAYAIPAEVTLKPGTFLTVRTNQMLASNKNHAGDIFTATLTQPLIANGVVIAQRGQTVAGVVAETGKEKDGKHFIRLQLNSITAADGTQIAVQSQLSSLAGRTTPGGMEAGAVVATTAVGAGIGGVAARGTGAAIGAGAGALVGLAAVIATHDHPAVLYPETALTFQLTAPATVTTSNSPQAFRFAGPEDYQPAQPTLVRSQPRPYAGASYAYPGYAYPGYYYGPGYYPGYYPYYYGPSIGIGFGGFYGRGWRR